MSFPAVASQDNPEGGDFSEHAASDREFRQTESFELKHSVLFNRDLQLIRSIYVLAIIVTAGLLIFAVRADQLSAQRWQATSRADARNDLGTLRAQLESNLNGNIQLVRGLPGLIALEPDLTQQQFERALKPLFEGRSQVRNIAAAPDMVISLMHPLAGNEKAVGLDYRATPKQFEAADRAVRLRQLVLAGPVDLVQGGTGFISRMPIFVSVEDTEQFWGLVSTVIDAEQLYQDSGLRANDLPLEIAIRGKDGRGPNGDLFFGSAQVFANDPVKTEIQLPQGSWEMAAVPKRGWTNPPDGIWIQRGMFLLAAAMTVVPLLMLARTRDRLLDVAVRRHQAEQERQNLERQVLHSQKLESLGVLAGGVAHDFNNILTAILGYGQLLACKPSLDSESTGFLTQINLAAERAAALCNQLLSYSGKGQFVIEPINVSDLIRETEALLQVSISKKTEVRLSLGDDIPLIEADASQLRQVVMNLITNATEAIGDRNGVVTITTQLAKMNDDDLKQNLAGNACSPGKYVLIRITDNGCGMSAATVKKIFDPFFTTKSNGQGLGMAAVLGVVRSLDGCILCESSIGQGSSFIVAFPPTAKRLRRPELTPNEPGVNVAGTVLVVDDEPAIRTIITKALTNLGFAVLAAKDGQQAIEIFERSAHEISLCIIDLSMPRMGGRETLRLIRRIQPDARAVLMSGYAEEEISEPTSTDHPNAFIKKPFGVNQLISVVRHVIDDSDDS